MKIYCFSEEDARLSAIKEIARDSTRSAIVGFDYTKEKWYVETEEFSIEERKNYWQWTDLQRQKLELLQKVERMEDED